MTNAELAILSLIVEQPRHGYQIEQVLEGRNMRDWTEIGFSSIYYILRKLEERGLVSSQKEESSGRGPGKKVYQPTTEGMAVWREATLLTLSSSNTKTNPFLIGLSNLPAFSSSEVAQALQEYLGDLDNRYKHVEVRWKEQSEHDLPFHVNAMFEYSLTMIESEIKWIKEFIIKMEEK